MKKTLLILFSMVLTFNVFAQKTDERITVEIDFGGNKPNQTYQIEFVEGMTALTALQYCTNIGTKPVGDYIFVSDIDSVKNIPYQMVWYYEINDQTPQLLAFRQPANKGDKFKWIYKEDVCSKRKDGVTIEIRFGEENRAKQIYAIDWNENLTVMNALQHFVLVETYSLEGKYIFVSSIDGKRTTAKESFWAYFLNGEKAHKIAANQLLNKRDRIIWEFRLNNQREPKPIYNE